MSERTMRPNVLLVTLDQFRGDCLSSLGHKVVRTPNLDALAKESTTFARHFSQSAPCSPGRASLYTGTYQMNHRVCFNGSPLDDRFDNVARSARRVGYSPALFGYTDQGVDPRTTTSANDPRLSSYQHILPGFDWVLDLSEPYVPWLAHLRAHGHDITDHVAALISEPERDESLSITAFLTDTFLGWLNDRGAHGPGASNTRAPARPADTPWFAHLSFLRPHPPYNAAGKWSRAYDPGAVDMPITPAADRHPFHDAVMQLPEASAPRTEAGMREMRAQYYGMIGEVDHHLGRIIETLRERGEWDRTVIVITADHGEQLGDHGLREKLGYFEQSYHIIGMVRSPQHTGGHARVVRAFTENVDVFPTLCDLIEAPIPAQCDGRSLVPWLSGDTPDDWRAMATWEYDWRQIYIDDDKNGSALNWPHDRRLERQNLCVQRDETSAYVQFGNGDWLAFDLATDPTWRTPITDAARVLPLAQRMLTWRSQHADRRLSGLKLESGGIGRWPAGVSWRESR
jgi:arylsulfatase A-like enzyme